jgi:hypothetical protein
MRAPTQRLIDKRLPPLTEVALAATALADLRHGQRSVGVDALKSILRRWLETSPNSESGSHQPWIWAVRPIAPEGRY